jgi:hypothetical protein
VPPSGAFTTSGSRQPFSLAADQISVALLNRTLGGIARTRNLTGVARMLERSPLSNLLRVQVAIIAQAKSGSGMCPSDRPGTYSFGGARERFDSGHRPATVTVHNCDVVLIRVANNSNYPVDVTPLYVDPWSRRYFLSGYPGSQYYGLRVEPRKAELISFTEVTSQSAGVSPTGKGRILLIATEADPAASVATDFRYLASSDEGKVRGAPGSLTKLLTSAGFGDGGVRAAPSLSIVSRAGAKVIEFETIE